MCQKTKLAAVAVVAMVMTGCATTKFVSSWKNPEATPIKKEKGQTVVACVVAQDEYTRHDAEDALVAELNKRGNKGVPSYSILLPGIKDEALAKAAFEKAGAAAVVVMRPLAVDEETSWSTSVYAGPYYGGFWGGYYGYGWGYPYGATYVTSDTIVIVETLFYSLPQNKLIWAGKSKTTNPSDVAKFVKELATAAAWEMNKVKVFAK